MASASWYWVLCSMMHISKHGSQRILVQGDVKHAAPTGHATTCGTCLWLVLSALEHVAQYN